MKFRPLRIAGGCASWALLLAATASAGADRLFFFIDEQGIPHFSNVPHDVRYQPLVSGIALDRSHQPKAAGELRLVLDGPTHGARRGQLIEVSVTLPGSQNMRGLVELQFDPLALRFEEASTDAYLAGPGRLHLELEPGMASVFATAIQFKVIGAARGHATLHGAVVDLEDEERRAVAVQPAAPLVVTFSP